MAPDSTAPVAERKLEWLEGMRGFAAVWVLVHHANQAVCHFLTGEPGVELIANGNLGVDFFFVLSGFIIAFSSHRLAASGGGLRDYFRARLVRIYVPYLPIGIAMFALYLLLPGLSAAERSPSVLSSFALLPTADPPALSVAWTLIHEMIFYVLCSVFFVSRRGFWILMACWAVAISAVAVAGTPLTIPVSYFLSPLNLCFLLGLMVFQARRWPLSSRMTVVAAVVGVAAVFSQAAQAAPNRILVALGFTLLVAAAASPHASRLPVPRFAVTLGAASYAIYLVHNPVLSLAVRAVRTIPGMTGYAAGMTAISSVALVAGILYWRYYERNALALAKARFGRGTRHDAGLRDRVAMR